MPKIFVTARKIWTPGDFPPNKMLSEDEALSKMATDFRIFFYGEVVFDPVGVEMITKLA